MEKESKAEIAHSFEYENQIAESVRRELFAMQDSAYRDFHSRLIPTVDREAVIGVRTPLLRRFARRFSKTPEALEFIKLLPHVYYEENNLHAFLIEQIRDLDAAVAALDIFLPYVDNWATCDMMSPKVFSGHHLPELLPHIRRWMASGSTYTVRYGIGMLMRYGLGEQFSVEYPAWVAALCGKDYYVNMMIAWYFATALALRYEEVLPYITEGRLSPWVLDRTVQKAVESYRICPERKAELRRYRSQREKRTGMS